MNVTNVSLKVKITIYPTGTTSTGRRNVHAQFHKCNSSVIYKVWILQTFYEHNTAQPRMRRGARSAVVRTQPECVRHPVLEFVRTRIQGRRTHLGLLRTNSDVQTNTVKIVNTVQIVRQNERNYTLHSFCRKNAIPFPFSDCNDTVSLQPCRCNQRKFMINFFAAGDDNWSSSFFPFVFFLPASSPSSQPQEPLLRLIVIVHSSRFVPLFLSTRSWQHQVVTTKNQLANLSSSILSLPRDPFAAGFATPSDCCVRASAPYEIRSSQNGIVDDSTPQFDLSVP
jgi:hypothetical protein